MFTVENNIVMRNKYVGVTRLAEFGYIINYSEFEEKYQFLNQMIDWGNI